MKSQLAFTMLLLLLTVGANAANIARVSGTKVYIDNGTITATVDAGKVTSLKLKGERELLANGGQGYFSFNDNDGFHASSGLTAKLAVNTATMADIYYVYKGSFAIEMHYVFRQNESGFYTYMVIADNGTSGKTLSEARFALRVDESVFNYGWTSEREGDMVSSADLRNYTKEIQDATYQLQDGSIYTKYDWAVYRNDDVLHGLMGPQYGIWNIEASREYVNGGPTMQDLTIHGTTTTPILLTYFHSSHFGSPRVELKSEYSEWRKIYGPAFTYINKGTRSGMLSNAKSKAQSKVYDWPYSWLTHASYAQQRGHLYGRFNLIGDAPVDSALVILSPTEPSWQTADAAWQYQPYGYIFWSEADNNGQFEIRNIVPGNYSLYAYSQKGKLIESFKQENISITNGDNDLGVIDWHANDRNSVLAKIGQANLKSSEFALAQQGRAYGMWFLTPETVSFNYPADNDKTDWYYCQQENTEWDIRFNLDDINLLSNPRLRVTLAGADVGPHLDIKINNKLIGTIHTSSDSGVRRSSVSGGKYSAYAFEFSKSLLLSGENKLTFNCYGSPGDYKALMYDAILLEADEDNTSVNLMPENSNDQITVASIGKHINIHADFKNEAQLRIYDLSGKLLYNNIHNSRSISIPMDRKGVYIITITSDKYLITKKVVCQ